MGFFRLPYSLPFSVLGLPLECKPVRSRSSSLVTQLAKFTCQPTLLTQLAILDHASCSPSQDTENNFTPTESKSPYNLRFAIPTISLSQYWLWCPIIAPFLGAQVAAGFYNLCLDDSNQITP